MSRKSGDRILRNTQDKKDLARSHLCILDMISSRAREMPDKYGLRITSAAVLSRTFIASSTCCLHETKTCAALRKGKGRDVNLPEPCLGHFPKYIGSISPGAVTPDLHSITHMTTTNNCEAPNISMEFDSSQHPETRTSKNR